MSNRSIDEKNILSVDRIEMSDTISQFMEKVNNNFSKIVESGGGPAGTKGDLGNQGVPTKPKVPIHVWKEGEECIESKINDQEFEITRCYEDLTNVKYQEGHIIMLQNGNVYTLEKDDSFNLKPKYVLTLQTYMPGEVVDGKRAFVHIAYADDDNGSGFVTESELSNGNYNQEPVATYNLRRNARAGINVLDKKYMGIYTNHTETPSLDPERYNWIKIQGSDGKVGDMGISSKFIMIYTSGKLENGGEFIPDKPIGGSYDFKTNEFICPDGWFQTDSEAEPPIWMASRTFTTSELSTDKEWSKPIRITGENGMPGEDGASIEYIFRLTYELTQEDLDALSYSPDNENKYVPEPWKGSPTGIDENNTREWCSIRLKNTATNKWGKWETPTIWSQYGLNGQDGDGVQYIYYLTNTATPPKNPTPIGFTTNDLYQDRNTEWKPEPGSYENLDGETLTFTKEDNWSDNPKDISVDKQYQWMACRKYRQNKEKKMAWEAFSNPTLWSRFGEKGESGTFIRTMYVTSKGTDDIPDRPTNSTGSGSQWSTEFPTDYIFGENVVWGTTAELKAGTNEFVDETKGWSTPYIVTGTKGVGEQGPKGDPGETGPAGNPGFDGIPGASLNILYCLGSEENPFGDKESWKQNPLEISGWFDILPNPNKIKLTDSKDNSKDGKESDILKTQEYLSDNRGRVVYVKDITTEEYTHKHYYINENSELVDLEELIGLPKIDEDFVSYVWAIQGTDIWSRENDEDKKTGIKWTAPFKLQGTNGIRGVAGADGNRGQVVYPMGVYNSETTYITTDAKAPYVFDNGNYYVLNIIGEWKGSDNAYTTPSQNYNHAIENNIKPIWEKFEGFEALFTKIGIIANGMVGSAVFNNEFMFSQQGINKDGNKTDYAIESGEDAGGNSGFLSGYEYDKNKKQWKYVGTDIYIEDINVNPYEEKDGTPIHSFRPNVCINFATGQMWLSNGKAVFDQDKTNLTTDVDLSFAIQQSVNEINEDIAKISSDATDVTNSLNDLNEVLSKSLEDGYLSKDEQVRIYSKLSDLIVQFKELKNEHLELLKNDFLKVDENTKEEFKDEIEKVKSDLDTSFGNLEKSHNMYKHEINILLGISFETPSTYNLKGDVTNKKFPKIKIYEALGKKWSYKYKTLDAVTGNYVDADWDWKDEIPNDKGEIPGFIDFQIKYENDLNNYLTQVLVTEKFIEDKFKIDIKDNISTQNNLLRDEFEDKLANWNDERLEDLANQITNINGGLDELQKQIDGEVSSYFEPFAPVIVEERKDVEKIYEYDKVILDVEPLKSWLENYTKNESGYYELNSDSDSDSKDELFNNLGDTFTNTQKYIDDEQTPLAGKSWRWCDATSAINANQITQDGCILVKRGEEYRYLHWHRITDTDALRALQMAAEAQATADKKCTLYISTENDDDKVPNNYNIGDLWILNQISLDNGNFNIVDGKYYTKDGENELISIGDILNAKEASVNYSVSHWSKQVKYTDDTAAKVAQQKADKAQEAADAAKKNADIAKAQLDAIDDDSVISKTEFATLETQLEQIESEHNKILSDCELYEITNLTTQDLEVNDSTYTYNTCYDNAIYALKYHCGKEYMPGKTAPFNEVEGEKVSINIVTNSIYVYNYNNINIYYDVRQVVLNEIAKKAKEYAEAYTKDAVDSIETDAINLINAIPARWTEKGLKETIEAGTLYRSCFENSDYQITSSLEVSGNIYLKIHSGDYLASISQFNDNNEYLGDEYRINWTDNLAITLHENTSKIGVTITHKENINTGTVGVEITKDNIKNVKIKIEKGNRCTPYTPAPEDISTEVLEAKQEALDVKESFDAVNDVLNKSLEDGKLSKEEVSRIKDSLKSLQKEFNELTQEYDDVIDIKINPYLVGDARTKLTSKYGTLKDNYDSYYNVLNALTSTEIYKAFDTAFKIDLSSFTFNTKYNFKWNNYSTSYESYQNDFTKSLKDYTQALTEAQISINEEIQNQAQKYADVGKLKGVNFCSYKKIIDAGFTYASELDTDGAFIISPSTAYSESFGTNNTTKKDMFGLENQYLENTQYTLKFNDITYITNDTDITKTVLLMRCDYTDGTIEYFDDNTFKNKMTEVSFTSAENKTIKLWRTSYGYSIKFKSKVKLEIGNIPTSYTISEDDVNYQISEVSTALENTNDVLSKSLEDGVIDNTEITRIKDALKSLGKEYNDLVRQNTALNENPYLKGSAKTYLSTYYGKLDEAYKSYKSALEKITSTAVINALKPTSTSRFKTIKINLTDFVSNWKYTTDYETPQTNFADALQEYTYYVTKAQESINEEIKNSIQVGGVNLIEFNKLENNGYLNFTKQRPNIIFQNNINDLYPAIQLPNYSVIKKGYEYVLSFNFKKISGTISKIGMPLTTTGCENVQIYIDNTLYPLNTGSNVGFTVDYTADTNEHKVVVKFKTISEVQYQTIIQFNRNLNTAFKVVVSNIQLEVGNVATEYKPNDADIIEARNNIIKNGMVVSCDNTEHIFELTEELTPNVEYIFSVENISENKTIDIFTDDKIKLDIPTNATTKWEVDGSTVSTVDGAIRGTSTTSQYPRIRYTGSNGFNVVVNDCYILTFDARSSADMNLSSYFGNNTGSISSMSFGSFSTTTNWQSYQLKAYPNSNVTSGTAVGLYFYIATSSIAQENRWTEFKNIKLTNTSSLEINSNEGSKNVIFTPTSNANTISIKYTSGNFSIYGCKLAKGNKYTPWEGTADEKKTLIMLNNAMHGSTETNGGLMLTNTIGMKGSTDESNTITAGINGLNSNVSGMSSDLRFWAGSNTWEDIQTAPFRVYDDGRVFGTHFYGYLSAIEINADNKSQYIDEYGFINFKKTGGSVILNLPTDDTTTIALPEAKDYIGCEVEIFNPKRKGVAFCNNMPEYRLCNIKNMFKTVQTKMLSGKTYYVDYNNENILTTDFDGFWFTDYYWKTIPSICTVKTSSPLYFKFKNVIIPQGSPGYSKTGDVKPSTYVGYDVQYNGSYYYVSTWILIEKID